jgi:hypothetical protein
MSMSMQIRDKLKELTDINIDFLDDDVYSDTSDESAIEIIDIDKEFAENGSELLPSEELEKNEAIPRTYRLIYLLF